MPLDFSDGALECNADELAVVVFEISEAENEEEVRLIDGTEDIVECIDSGELGERGETGSGEDILGTGSTGHSDNECLFRLVWSREIVRSHENFGPVTERSEAHAEVVGENEPHAYEPPDVLTVKLGDAFGTFGVNFDDFEDVTENWDIVRARRCEGKKSGRF